uniref:Uncharacterized protein n=1 Tax=Oryza brachyantha TaxID=4533 RepID=J3L3Q4_ORYBR
MTTRSIATKYLDDPNPLSPEQLEWAIGTELTARQMADDFTSTLMDFRRGLSVFFGTVRPEEEALRKNSVWLDMRRAEATEIVSTTRLSQDKHLNHIMSLATIDGLVETEIVELINTARRPGEEALAIMPPTQLVVSQAFATTIRRYRALFTEANILANVMHKQSSSENSITKRPP